MLMAFSSLRDPNRGKPVGAPCVECHCALPLSSEFTVEVPTGRVHALCFTRKLTRVGN